MRIIHVITGLGDGGAEAVLYRLCLHDPGNQHMVVSLSGPGKYGPRLRRLGFPVYCLNMAPGRLKPRGLWQLWRLLRVERPDLVQTWMYHANLAGGVVAWLAGSIDTVWGIHHTTLERGKSKRTTILLARLSAWLSRGVPRKIVYCSDSAAAVHESIGYSPDRKAVIYNGYDLTEFKPNAAWALAVRQELGIDPDAILIGMVGRFDPQKDHPNLLHALAHVRALGHEIYCLLVGNGLELKNELLMSWIDERSLNDRVLPVGQRTDVPAIMNALDVHVLSSAYGEAFPNVLSESMACGTPCVTSDVGDSALIVGDTGWVVPPKNPDALAGALVQAVIALSDKEAWAQRQKDCRERIESNFSVDAMVTRYNEVWQSES